MIKIRPAKIKDLSEIVAMRLKLLKYHEKLDRYEAGKKDADTTFYKFYKSGINSKKVKILVAEENSKLVGFGHATIVKTHVFKIKYHGNINDMYIKGRYRREGIAGKILQSYFYWFKKKGIKYVELSVHCKNEIGKNAWNKYGFKDFLIRKRITLK
jgi:GNAT superfamily N-acetyltransferase